MHKEKVSEPELPLHSPPCRAPAASVALLLEGEWISHLRGAQIKQDNKLTGARIECTLQRANTNTPFNFFGRFRCAGLEPKVCASSPNVFSSLGMRRGLTQT